MLKICAGSFIAAWVLLFLIAASGNLVWSNKLLWGPPALLGLSTCIGLGAWEAEEDRAALLGIGLASFCCILAYAVFYFFLFALVGH